MRALQLQHQTATAAAAAAETALSDAAAARQSLRSRLLASEEAVKDLRAKVQEKDAELKTAALDMKILVV